MPRRGGGGSFPIDVFPEDGLTASAYASTVYASTVLLHATSSTLLDARVAQQMQPVNATAGWRLGVQRANYSSERKDWLANSSAGWAEIEFAIEVPGSR